MLSCICGGFFEIIALLCSFFIAIVASFLTYVCDRVRYKKYLNYHKKHNDCSCDCHKDDEDIKP
jgi:hypothetical protein